ncbi:MAG: hypothetical protein ACRC5T_14115 [Cetobacterium sp.]
MKNRKVIERKRLNKVFLKSFLKEEFHQEICKREKLLYEAKSLLEEIEGKELCSVTLEIKKSVLKSLCNKIKESDIQINNYLEISCKKIKGS